MDTSRRASIWARVLLFLGTLALLLAPLEWLARQRFEPRYWRLARESESAATSASSDPERVVYLIDLVRPLPLRDLVYELKASFSGRFLDCSYRSNSWGMRGPAVSSDKPPGTYRIALLGDSYAFGWGVELEQSFGCLLEQRLNAVGGGRRVEVLNFAVPGYNTAMEAACLERKVPAFEPDLVLVQYYKNDEYLPVFLLDEPERPVSYVAAWIGELLGLRAARGPALTKPSRDQLAEDGAEPEPETPMAAWRRDPAQVPAELQSMVGPAGVERALQRIHDVAASIGAPVVVLVVEMPSLEMVRPGSLETEPGPEWGPQRLAESLGFTVIHTLAPLVDFLRAAGRSPFELILSPKDWHPNAEGHALFARILLDGLNRAGLPPPLR